MSQASYVENGKSMLASPMAVIGVHGYQPCELIRRRAGLHFQSITQDSKERGNLSDWYNPLQTLLGHVDGFRHYLTGRPGHPTSIGLLMVEPPVQTVDHRLEPVLPKHVKRRQARRLAESVTKEPQKHPDTSHVLKRRGLNRERTYLDQTSLTIGPDEFNPHVIP
jgi:hypothetical protein